MMNTSGRKLSRSPSNRMLAGVCGGLGDFFGVNPFWFRLAFILALAPGGIPGIGGYLIFWLIMPSA